MGQYPVNATSFSLASEPPCEPPRDSPPELPANSDDHKLRDPRHLSLFRVGALSVEGRRELCLIRNVSSGGMQIRAYSDIAPGAKVVVELKQGEPISGTAQWARGGSLGIAFDQPVDVVALLAASSDGPQPRMPRIGIDCAAWVREGADLIKTRALNISQGGIAVRSSVDWVLDANVVVSIHGLKPEPAVIKWADNERFGIGFNRVLPVAELVAWLHAQRRSGTAKL